MANRHKSDKDFEQQYRVARKLGKQRLKSSPRAKSAYYDSASRRIVVELVNQCKFIFPPELAQGLHEASDEELSEIRVLSQGLALDWPRLDAQFSVAGLLVGVFGTKKWMDGICSQDGGSQSRVAEAVDTSRDSHTASSIIGDSALQEESPWKRR
ncbi:DUF2442 domain-containing protein [Candidatus Poribacteria bacterium]|nr:DUF2442 domain-containing protein [Candidatus Poribacteria bacterium]